MLVRHVPPLIDALRSASVPEPWGDLTKRALFSVGGLLLLVVGQLGRRARGGERQLASPGTDQREVAGSGALR
jgi:hypothetical protein